MKTILMIVLFAFATQAQAVTNHKISCKGQWKSTQATPFSFYIVVKDLFTPKAKVLSKKPVPGDDWEQRIFGLKKIKNDHEANEAFYQMAMGDPVKGWPGATEGYAGLTKDGKGLIVNLDDGVESNIDVVLYKGSNYTTGYVTNFCAPSYCGDFDFFAMIKCTVSVVAGN